MNSLDPELQELLSSYKQYFSIQDNGKIMCEVNGHTLPPRYDVVSAFIKGPKFQKMIRRHMAEDALAKYEPFIVQSKNFPLMLYCALTGQLMDKSVEAVKKHMQGKKFKRAKERFTNDEIDLRPEPSLESFGIRVPKDKQQQQQQNGNEQQQEERQVSKSSSKQRQLQHHQANGSAAAAADGSAGSDDEPEFWMPESDADSDQGEDEDDSGSDGDDDLEAEAAAAAAAAGGSSDAMDEDMTAGPSDAAGAQPMDEDAPPSKSKQQPPPAAVKQKKRTAGSKARGQQQRQVAAVGDGTAAGRKKNISRPSAAKKAKR